MYTPHHLRNGRAQLELSDSVPSLQPHTFSFSLIIWGVFLLPAQEFFLEGKSNFWGGPLYLRDRRPPTKPPSSAPTQTDKKGTDLLLFEFCIPLHTH